MWFTCFDVQPESKTGQFLAKKRVSLVTGNIQLVIWILTIFKYIFRPAYMKDIFENMSNSSFALSIIINLVVIGFSVFLLFGLYKDRANIIKIYLIFDIVFIIVSIISIIMALIMQLKQYSAFAYFGATFAVLLHMLFYFIFRNYYLSLLNNQLNENHA